MVTEITTIISQKYGLLLAFTLVGIIMWLSNYSAKKFTNNRLHGSAIAIGIGLLLAYVCGLKTGGHKGVADIGVLTGFSLMGGSMLRDFAIVATAFGVNLDDVKQAGLLGAVSVVIGVTLSFVIGAIIALGFGYHDPVAITTIGAGAATYIVGPVTGTALGASSDVIALSIAAGLVKSIFTMIATPLVAKHIGLDNPVAAMIFGGMMGTTSGTAAGLAATDPALVPYGAMTATFYTGVGCLLAPSLFFIIVSSIFTG